MTTATTRGDKRTAAAPIAAAAEPTATILPPISGFDSDRDLGAFTATPPPPHKLPKLLPSLSSDLLASHHQLPPILPRPHDDDAHPLAPLMSSTPPPSVSYSSSGSSAAGTPPVLPGRPALGDRRPSMLAAAGTRQERDAARRDTHKEIERRRRLTINHDIEELARLVGATKESKHAVLRRALDYMHQLIAENHQLRSQLEQQQHPPNQF